MQIISDALLLIGFFSLILPLFMAFAGLKIAKIRNVKSVRRIDVLQSFRSSYYFLPCGLSGQWKIILISILSRQLKLEKLLQLTMVKLNI